MWLGVVHLGTFICWEQYEAQAETPQNSESVISMMGLKGEV